MYSSLKALTERRALPLASPLWTNTNYVLTAARRDDDDGDDDTAGCVEDLSADVLQRTARATDVVACAAPCRTAAPLHIRHSDNRRRIRRDRQSLSLALLSCPLPLHPHPPSLPPRPPVAHA